MNNAAVVNRLKFMRMVSEKHPALYRAIMGNVMTNVMGDDAPTSLWGKFTSGLESLAKTFVTTKAGLDQLKVNVSRASSGLAPVDFTSSQTYQPSTSPNDADVAIASSGSGISPLTLILLAVGAGFLFFMRGRG